MLLSPNSIIFYCREKALYMINFWNFIVSAIIIIIVRKRIQTTILLWKQKFPSFTEVLLHIFNIFY